MTIAVIHLTKGGAGKTTLATNLSVEMAKRGLKPVLVDLDQDQGASVQFMKARYGYDKLDIDLYSTPSIQTIENCIKAGEAMVFDTGGYDSSTTQALIATADTVLIPVLNNDIEKNALIKLSDKLHKIIEITGKVIDFVIVPTRIHTSCTIDKARDYFKDLEALGYRVSNPIYYRLAYQKAFNAGEGVVEGKDKKARAEIEDLADMVLGAENDK